MAVSESVIREQSNDHNLRMNSSAEFRGTGSLMDLVDNSFIFQPSAFTLPNNPCRLFLPNQEGTHSLPLRCGNTVIKSTVQSTNPTDDRSAERLRKTHSSRSLTSIPDGPYNDIWAGSITLRRTAKPNLENERHRENSLRLSILEARNLPSKRRYYCDICLDRTLYARTTSKTASSEVFWAEDFDLNNLPNVSFMTISLYKEAETVSKELRRFGTSRMSAKKLRKTQNQLVGFVTVPSSEITSRNDVQVWLTLQPPVESSDRDLALFHLAAVGTIPIAHNPMDDTIRPDESSVLQSSNSFITLNGKQPFATVDHPDQSTMPQIRIRARYRSVDVLPHRDYWVLKAFLLEHGLLLTNWLDTILPVKTKEEVANSLVGLHECNGTLVNFLTDLVVSEVSKLGESHTACMLFNVNGYFLIFSNTTHVASSFSHFISSLW
ncbi:Synaptic ras gtpase activating protein syngap [Fasciolopsis buskii]|uniref:Synaptic ras gtpase activating protein syngap n=1 Tax=Fasciolopsis buskii TaxID=27845 RepID=A0A8E0VIQ3_9TREM|nr:Synaptic ras gtpase activating protein syngap [Fasciolopsis buski]